MVRKNPLNRRFLRQLKNDAGKYLTIFLLLTLSISFVSGFLVADNSMIITYDESFEKYNIEDGHFRVSSRLNRGQEKRIQAQGVSICELFYGDEAFDNGSTLRIFANRDAVNLVCVMDGRFPETADEIIIDRMYADNNHIRTGDTMQGAGKTWKVCGLAALSDYSTMFESNSDSMFDAVRFGVAVVSKEGFASIPFASMQYCYAWKYQSESSESEQDRAETLMEKLNEITELRDYVPRYLNQAIMFTGDDMGSDKVMMEVLLYIIIVICAFVFGVTISDTINKESAVIGTLRAQGYTRSEIIIHYMTLPVVITLISAAIGNLLGYTLMKDFCASMYYDSYSLPTYITKYNPEALFRTTVIPCLIMAAVTWFFLHRKLKLSPLRFFRKIFPAQMTAFSTQSSVGTLPVTVRCLKDEVGVSEEVADFTASLGTTIGMPGCTCVWPVLLALFYVHAAGLSWSAGDYLTLAVTAFFLSIGSAGVPGIAVVSAIALFSAIGLPVGAVVLMIPINTISDMIRTLDNVSSASIAAAAVARKNGLLDDTVFTAETNRTGKEQIV